MELMKEFLKILRKTWLAMLIMALLMAVSIFGLIKTMPRVLGPAVKDFKEAIK